MTDELNPQGDELDYEELRRQMMGSMPMRQPAPATMASSEPQPSSVGDIIASSGRPAPSQPTEVQPPSVGSIIARNSQPPAGVVKSGPLPAEIPQPPSIGSVIASAGGPRPIPSIVAPATPHPSAIPAPPGNGLPDLISQRAKAGQPIDPRAVDPNTGKPMYRMGMGMRLLGTLANFASGFGRSGAPPIYVGPGATNARYGREKEMQAENVANLDTQIGNTEKLNTEQQNLYNSAIKQAYESQLGESRGETADARMKAAEAAGQTADIKGQLVQSQIDKNEKGTDQIGQRMSDADRMGLKGEDRKYYVANGKLKEDTGNGRAPTELEEWSAAFRRDNGRPPTADEIANRKTRTGMLAEKIEKDKNDELQKAEDKAIKRIETEGKRFLGYPGVPPTPQQAAGLEKVKQDAYADLEKDKARIQSTYEARAKEANLLGGRSTLQSKPGATTPAKPTQPTTPTQTAPTGNVPPKPTVAPKLGKTWVYNKSTGVRGLVKNEDLKKATQGKDAQYATW